MAENDGVKLMDALSSLENPDSVPELLGHIEGPYVFFFGLRDNCVKNVLNSYAFTFYHVRLSFTTC